MNDKIRYKQLIEENNESINELNEQYKNIAITYVNKARGKGVKNLDTEVRIKDTLNLLTRYSDANINQKDVITDVTSFIEENVKLITPRKSFNKNILFEILAIGVIFLMFIGYFTITYIVNKKANLANIENLMVEEVQISDTQNYYFRLSWNKNQLAEEGYTVIVYKDDIEIKTTTIDKYILEDKQVANLKDCIIEKNKTYKFIIYANATKNYNASEKLEYTYIPN